MPTFLGLLLLLWASTAPVVKHVDVPGYPWMANLANVQGDVAVKVHIDSHGAVVSAQATSGHAMLRAEAEENVKRWVFEPGAEGDSVITYEFRIAGEAVAYRPLPKVSLDLPSRVRITVPPIAQLHGPEQSKERKKDK